MWQRSESKTTMEEQVELDEVVFPEGLIGCPDWRQFVFLAGPADSLVLRLQCVDDPSVCFLVTEPRYIEQDYQVSIRQEELSSLGLDSLEEALILCTLSVHGEPPVVTANLLAPFVVNVRSKVARQVILADSGYSTRHPVMVQSPEETRCPAGEEK